MNILVVNDDGPNAYGLRVLLAAVKKNWRHSKIVALVPKTDQSGVGMGVKSRPEKLKPKKEGSGLFVVPSATPVDLVHLAFVRSENFIPAGQRFDLVLAGVNHGANVGMSVLTSGTVGAAMLAAMHYGSCGWAFSQAFGPSGVPGGKPKNDAETRRAFVNAVRYVPHFFENQKPFPGECLNVNFPAQKVTKGWVQCLTAPYDPFIGDSFTPLNAKQGQLDAVCLNEGYITRAPIVLSYNPPLSW